MRVNHKDIGTLYILSGVWAGMIGISLRFIIRLELARPGAIMLGRTQMYNSFVTLHGIIMIFFLIMPIMMGGLGNWLIPLMIGGLDITFPRVNNFSYWFLPGAMLIAIGSMQVEGGRGTGWTVYPPLSSIEGHGRSAVDMLALSLHLAGASSIAGSINYMITRKHVPHLSIRGENLPLFVTAIVVASVLLVVSLPVLAGGITMLLFDRHLNTCFYDPRGGGDPILYQHLF